MALEQDGLEVCAEAANAAEAVSAALRERPDACVIDVHMPGEGTSAVSRIKSQLPGTVVLMLTVSDDHEDLLESLRRGATGYLLKDTDPAELPGAVRAALRGEGILPGNLTAGLIEEFRRRPPPRRLDLQDGGRVELSAREWEVLELLCADASTLEMADRLFLSPVTVRRHISSIVSKFGVSSREEAVRLALGDEASDQVSER